MDTRRSPTKALPGQAEAVALPAVLGLRDTWLLAGVRAAISSSGFAVVDVAVSTNQLLYMTAYQRPRLVVVALDVLGTEPARVIRRALTCSADTAMVVLSPLETVPVWLLETGADAVVVQTEIGELKRVLWELRYR